MRIFRGSDITAQCCIYAGLHLEIDPRGGEMSIYEKETLDAGIRLCVLEPKRTSLKLGRWVGDHFNG